MRADQDSYLSVNWLEHTGFQTRVGQLSVVRQHLLAGGMGLRQKGKLAVLHLKETIDYVRSQAPDGRSLYACHEFLPEAPSHAGMYGYKPEDELIADLIAFMAVEIYPAR